MSRRADRKTLLLVLLLSGCAPPACSDDAERALRKDVQLVVQDDSALSVAAHSRLVKRGADAIPVVETGFYAANPRARLRLVRVLADLRSRQALPVLEHVARRDPDETVRQAATGAISSLQVP